MLLQAERQPFVHSAKQQHAAGNRFPKRHVGLTICADTGALLSLPVASWLVPRPVWCYVTLSYIQYELPLLGQIVHLSLAHPPLATDWRQRQSYQIEVADHPDCKSKQFNVCRKVHHGAALASTTAHHLAGGRDRVRRRGAVVLARRRCGVSHEAGRRAAGDARRPQRRSQRPRRRRPRLGLLLCSARVPVTK